MVKSADGRTHEPSLRELTAQLDDLKELMTEKDKSLRDLVNERDRLYTTQFRSAKEEVASALTSAKEAVVKAEAAVEKEARLGCLDTCLEQLEDAHRQIITRYYVGQERTTIDNRRALAKSLGITINALSIRTCRIRGKLEKCVRECLGDH